MPVAIAIVGYRNLGDVAACLSALAVSTHADFEVVICENGGDAAFGDLRAATPETLPGGQCVRLISAPENPGYAGGVNRCLAHSLSADAWWILNPDTEPAPGALAALVRRLQQGDCDAVGGVLCGPDGGVGSFGGLWRPWLARAVALGHGAPGVATADPGRIERRQNYLSGASMLVSARFLKSVGPMREDYFLYCEEVEWCLRARRRGMRLGFTPDAVVVHRQGSTTGSAEAIGKRSRPPVYLDARNQMLLTRDCFAWRLPVTAPAALVLLAARYLRRGAWRQFAYAVSGWAAGLAGERGRPTWIAA